MQKLIRITTIPIALQNLLKGQLKFMNEHYDVIGVSSSGSSIDNIVANEGIRMIEVNMTRSITPIADLKSLYKLYKVFKKERPFIVHSHTPKAGTLSMLAAKLARVPHRLHTIAGLPLLEATGAKRLLLDIVEKITYRCATKIYPNSFGLKNIIIENGYAKENKLLVIGNGSSNGIDVDHFSKEKISESTISSLRNSLDINEEDVVFTFVGRLVTDKGINELIFAFERLNSIKTKTKLLLVGTYESKLDPLKNETLDKIEKNRNIVSVGWQTDVRPYFAISDVLAFPSYREGFPNVVMQAGAMELPSIVTNINGCNEIIANDVNGLIISPKDEEELYRAMLNLVENPEQRNSLGTASRALIYKRYNRDIIWNSLLMEYQNLE